MPRVVTSLARALVTILLALSACSAKDPPATRLTCARDTDCTPRRYCTAAGICRADCRDDTDCIYVSGQCNAAGRCVEPLDAAGPDFDSALPGGDARVDVRREGGK